MTVLSTCYRMLQNSAKHLELKFQFCVYIVPVREMKLSIQSVRTMEDGNQIQTVCCIYVLKVVTASESHVCLLLIL